MKGHVKKAFEAKFSGLDFSESDDEQPYYTEATTLLLFRAFKEGFMYSEERRGVNYSSHYVVAAMVKDRPKFAQEPDLYEDYLRAQLECSKLHKATNTRHGIYKLITRMKKKGLQNVSGTNTARDQGLD